MIIYGWLSFVNDNHRDSKCKGNKCLCVLLKETSESKSKPDQNRLCVLTIVDVGVNVRLFKRYLLQENSSIRDAFSIVTTLSLVVFRTH